MFSCMCSALVPIFAPRRNGKNSEHLSFSHTPVRLLHKSSGLLDASSKALLLSLIYSFLRIVLSYCQSYHRPSKSELQFNSEERYRYRSKYFRVFCIFFQNGVTKLSSTVYSQFGPFFLCAFLRRLMFHRLFASSSCP